MKFSLTAFKSIYDNKTSRQYHHNNWESFESMLYKMSKIPGYKLKKGEFRPPYGLTSSPLISPASYLPDTTRSNNSVICWSGWAALDIDDHVFNGDLEKELHEKYGKNYYVCYSTSSSTIEHPKFRLVFPLTDVVNKECIKHFWFALNREFDDLGDAQTKDLSRLYYVPAIYPNANNFIFTNVGKFIDPAELMSKHKEEGIKRPLTLFEQMPTDIQRMVIAQRADALKDEANMDYHWTTYSDCPFVNKSLIADYTSISRTDGSGRYSMIYKIMASIACSAVRKKYPINAVQLEELIRQLDRDTSNCYSKRPLNVESERALDFAYRNL